MIASEPRRIPSTDGYTLAATVFRPPATRPVKQVVLICSAMGVRQSFYFDFAEYVAERGRAVIAFDYRGIGGSAPPRLRGFRADLEQWGRLDIAAMIELARREFPEVPLSVVAHSVGGQILGLATNVGEVRDVLTFGAQSGYWGHWKGRGRLGVWLLWHLLIPGLAPLLGYFPASRFGLGDDLPAGVARRWAHWGRHPDYLAGRLDEASLLGYGRFSGRLRSLTASDDGIAPEPAARAMLDFYPESRSEYRLLHPEELGVPAIGHFGYFRESVGRRLWPTEIDWLFDD